MLVIRKPPKIGARIIKTALSILITLILTDVVARTIFGLLFEFDYMSVSIAVVACIVVMQDSVKSTMRASKERIAATTIGIVVGVLLMLILLPFGKEDMYDLQRLLFYILASLGSVIVLYVCLLFRGSNLSSLSVIVFVSVLFAYSNQNPLIAAAMRLIETIIGIVVTVSVNLTIYPPPLECSNIDRFNIIKKNNFSTRCAFCIKPKGKSNRCKDCQQEEFDAHFIAHDNCDY